MKNCYYVSYNCYKHAYVNIISNLEFAGEALADEIKRRLKETENAEIVIHYIDKIVDKGEYYASERMYTE